MITNTKLLRIMERISDATATEEEIFEFNKWCDSFKGTETEIPNLQDIQAKVLMKVHKRIVKSPKVFPLYSKRMVIAAAAIAAIAFGIWFFSAPRYPSQGPALAKYASDIPPGKNTATITLANGKTITLSDAKSGILIAGTKLTYNDGTAIDAIGNAVNAGQDLTQTISTPRGGTYQITLSDGTKVWLNAASSLTYSTALNKHRQRSVILNGEGYFEVAHREKQSFVVHTTNQVVEVLGTHFNVHAYSDEETQVTTLLEGSVKTNCKGHELLLKPGQQSIHYLKSGALDAKNADIEQAMGWKNDVFIFKDEDLASVMKEVARWYDVEVVFKDFDPKSIKLVGLVSRKKNISVVLKIVESITDVQFKIEGRRVTVMK